MTEQKQDDQHEHTYSSYVRIWDVVLKTCRRRWTIGRSGERGSGISVLVARHDVDDDYSPDLPPWLGAQSENPWFWAYLTFLDDQCSYNLSKISWTIWLLYWVLLYHPLLYSKCFRLLSSIMAKFKLIKHKFPNWTMLDFHRYNFQITMKWSNTQHVSAPPTTILKKSVCIFHKLNCFSHIVYVPQTSIYQNTAKLLTQFCNMVTCRWIIANLAISLILYGCTKYFVKV